MVEGEADETAEDGEEAGALAGEGDEEETETGAGGIRKPSSVRLGRGRSFDSREAENPQTLDFLMMSVGMAGLFLSTGGSEWPGWASVAFNGALSLEVFLNLSLSSGSFCGGLLFADMPDSSSCVSGSCKWEYSVSGSCLWM